MKALECVWAFAWWYAYCVGAYSGTVIDENHGYHTWARTWRPCGTARVRYD